MMIYPHANISTHQHANTPTYQHWYVGTYRQERNRFYTVKNRKSKIGNNGKGTRNSVGLPVLQAVLPLQERGNHFRLQRQSKHGAFRRLQGRAATPFPDKSSSRLAASIFIGKTLYPTAPCKRAFENGNDRSATHRRGKIIRKAGLERTGLWQAHFGTFGTVGKAGTASADSRHEAWSREDTDRPQTRLRVFTEKIP